jgi:hypothetical protein
MAAFSGHSFNMAYWFQRKLFLNIFPIEPYVKTISADGGHLGWRLESQDTILKVDQLKPPSADIVLT